MEQRNIYKDISERTDGDIYIGVVGPVRTGKSTFTKRFMDTLVIPNIQEIYKRERAQDELPQSAGGRTIMTTEPKFIPEEAAEITIDDNINFKVRLIDCVGYVVDDALGYMEEETPRMVKTPWFENEVPFEKAAEYGTRKVIEDHSTIGLVITTDGSVTDIDRNEYIEAERKVITELKAIDKPFIVLLNTIDPQSDSALSLSAQLSSEYQVPVIPTSCEELDENEIKRILAQVLFEFPVREIKVDIPSWVVSLDYNHPVRRSIFDSIKENSAEITKVRHIHSAVDKIIENEYILSASLLNLDLGRGEAKVSVNVTSKLFFEILSRQTGLDIPDEKALLLRFSEMSDKQSKLDRIAKAYDEVMESGYGIVMPTMEELTLEEPKIIKQSGKYGVKLKATAPSVHLMRVETGAEVTPVVGSEQQSEELVKFLLSEFEEDPVKIWQSDIFGKSLHQLVSEGLNNKLYRMPMDARRKLSETVEKIINDGCNGLICIIL